MKKRVRAFGRDIGIDLGSSSTRIYLRGRGIALQEPSLAAVDQQSGRARCFGQEALELLARAPGSAAPARPLRHGLITNLPLAERMLRDFLHRSGAGGLFKPRLLICVPSGIHEVEERAVIDAGLQAGAKRVYLMRGAAAAAIGGGLDPGRAEGQMVLDIGGGSTDIALLSLGDIVASACIPVGGDQFNASIIRYVRSTHRLLIGDAVAEALKLEIGCVRALPSLGAAEARGRALDSGLPGSVLLSSQEMIAPLAAEAERILEALEELLERTPAELHSDIRAKGILLTGGGSLLPGLDQLIRTRCGIPIRRAGDPLNSAIEGVGHVLEEPSALGSGALIRAFTAQA